MKLTEEQIKGKFVIAYDTICQGWCCMMDGEEGDDNYAPMLFDSEDEAFIEIFDGNTSMLRSHFEDGLLEDLNEGVTEEMIEEMEDLLEDLLKHGNTQKMHKFMDEHPECDDSGEWVEPAETFIMNRKAIFGEIGLVITGTKLTEL